MWQHPTFQHVRSQLGSSQAQAWTIYESTPVPVCQRSMGANSSSPETSSGSASDSSQFAATSHTPYVQPVSVMVATGSTTQHHAYDGDSSVSMQPRALQLPSYEEALRDALGNPTEKLNTGNSGNPSRQTWNPLLKNLYNRILNAAIVEQIDEAEYGNKSWFDANPDANMQDYPPNCTRC